jgi:hypothetical protein
MSENNKNSDEENAIVFKCPWWEEDEFYDPDFDPDDFGGHFDGKARSKTTSESNSMRSLDEWSRPPTPSVYQTNLASRNCDIAEVCEDSERNNGDDNEDESDTGLEAFDFSTFETEEDEKWYDGDYDEKKVMGTYHKMCEYMHNLLVNDPKEAAKQDVNFKVNSVLFEN